MSDHFILAPGSRGGDRFAGKIAVLIAVLATLGTLFAFLGSSSHNDAAMYKSNAAIDKTSAANAWSHYQAKSNKQNLAELAANLPGMNQLRYRDEVSRYQTEKEVIRKEAERWESSSSEWNRRAEDELHRQRQWAAASVAQQIAISLAAITLLARRTWLLTLTCAVAAFGITLGIFAALHSTPTAFSPVPLMSALAAAALTEGLRRASRRLDN
ncbi:DUF4337 domain-containing protein [Massilia sp. ST3]|uniref:DUF4337 domain-containing protein n=1 Tax=Massilia sp. ST3 TaxID=2824903 RepID=UPI001B8171A1|nr:DUF4337 domain-containing protein [Massilia sp. ST3]MBQ5947742.1 DUF4337 domain-containing protein [Massilia sp. ST3]